MVLIPASQPTEWSAIDAGALEDQDLISGLQEIVAAENTLASLKLRVLAEIDTRGLAKQLGSKTTGDWFANTGTTNPGTAKRMVRTAVGLDALPTVSDALRGGEISAEHAAAIVSAMAEIDRVVPDLDTSVRAAAIETLLTVARVHAPHLVADKGRDLLLRFRPRETDVPSEDATRNYLEISRTRTGRTRIVGGLRRPQRGQAAHRALTAGQAGTRRGRHPRRAHPQPAQRRRAGHDAGSVPGLGCRAHRGRGEAAPGAHHEAARPRHRRSGRHRIPSGSASRRRSASNGVARSRRNWR